MNPLGLVFGTAFIHVQQKRQNQKHRIVFVEAVDGFVLRFLVEGTQDEEYLVEVAPGVMARPTIRWLLEEFAAGWLHECSHDDDTVSEWRGRYLGWDISACLAKDPQSVLKYDLALRALQAGMPRSDGALVSFAKKTWPAGTKLPSGRSIIRWMDNLQAFDRRPGSMCNRSGREKGQSQLPPIVDRLVHQSMALFYAEEHFKKMDAHALVVAAWKRLQDRGVPDIGDRPPNKSTVINRINKCENAETYSSKWGRERAEKYFHASGNVMAVGRPFELVLMDGTELKQVTLFSKDVEIPSQKLKVVGLMDAYSLFKFPDAPFGGPYRPEMGMGAIMGALTPPALTDEMIADNPMLLLCFGRIGHLRVDNDKALIPPSAVGNIASVVRTVELARRFASDEKSNLENYWGWIKHRLDGEPGTVLSARSRRRNIRYDPLEDASLTRQALVEKYEALRLEWNDTGHKALGWRTPNEVMLEHVTKSRVRFTPPAEVRRHLARTERGVLTNDGIVHDDILYKWHRQGVTQTLSRNHAAEKIRSRLAGTARCEVWLRVYDWNLDSIEIVDVAGNEYVELWSDDPDYTRFLTRYEHAFHKICVASGATGAQTATERALRRAKSLEQQMKVVEEKPFTIAKKAAAILEQYETRQLGGSLADDPDLTDFEHLLLPTGVGGADRVDPPTGPSQKRPDDKAGEKKKHGKGPPDIPPDWSGLDPDPKSNSDLLSAQQDDPDDGIDWDELDDTQDDQGSGQ